MDALPYLRIRFGLRGDAFARTDSGYLTTLASFPLEHVVEQVRWLARVLSSRGMPSWIMETHLEILTAELTAAMPERGHEFRKLRYAAQALRTERLAIIPEALFVDLSKTFAEQTGDRIPHFGEVVLSAVCDKACGIDAAVTSVAAWLEASDSLPAAWRARVTDLIDRAQQVAQRPRTAP